MEEAAESIKSDPFEIKDADSLAEASETPGKVDAHEMRQVDSQEMRKVDAHEVRQVDSEEMKKVDAQEMRQVDSHKMRQVDAHEMGGSMPMPTR